MARLEEEIKLQQLVGLGFFFFFCDLLKLNRRVNRMKNERKDGAKSTFCGILFLVSICKASDLKEKCHEVKLQYSSYVKNSQPKS